MIYSMLELQVALYELLKNFEFSPPPGDIKIIGTAAILLTPMYGIYLDCIALAYSLSQDQRGKGLAGPNATHNFSIALSIFPIDPKLGHGQMNYCD